MEKKRFVFATVFAVLAVWVLAGCESPTSGSTGVDSSVKAGYVRLTVNIGHDDVPAVKNNRALSLFPTETFSYKADFTATDDKGETQLNVPAKDKAITVDLKAGAYEITVKGTYGGTEIAIGTTTVTVAVGTQPDPVIVAMKPNTTGDGISNGSFSYNITFPSDVNTATMTIHPETGSDTQVDLKTTGSGTKSLAPGCYTVTVSLLRGSDHAGVVEVLYIYSGLTSALEHAFIIDDFLEVMATITIEDGEQEIPISNLQMPLVVEQGGSVVLTVPAASGFGTVTWYVDAISAGASSSTLTLPASYTVGTHTLSVTAKKNGNLYSRSFTFTVTAASGGEVPESPGEGESGGSDTGDESDELTASVSLLQTQSNTSGTDISSGISGTGAAQTASLSVEEEPAVFFAIEKTAAQTITVNGADAAKVTKITEGSLDGSTASATFNLFSVNMEDLLFNGAFGESTDGSAIPSGTETRTFTLRVSEPSHTSRVITVTLGLSLDTTSETTIYHREGEPGNYHYVKVRDAELTENDKTNYSGTTATFAAFTQGSVKDLQNAFVWVDHYGTAGDSTVGAASFASETPSTDGYSEYRLFVKKNQEIGKIIFSMMDTQTKADNIRDYISIELWGAGTPGAREQEITRSEAFSIYTVESVVKVLNSISLSGSGLLSLAGYKTADKRHKALVLGKNITLAGDEVEILGTGTSQWRGINVEYLLYVDANALVIVDDYAKITKYLGIKTPITVKSGGTVYLKGGAITGNTFTATATTPDWIVTTATSGSNVRVGSTSIEGNIKTSTGKAVTKVSG